MRIQKALFFITILASGIVGTILTVMTQWNALTGDAVFAVDEVAMAFGALFIVSILTSYGAVRIESQREGSAETATVCLDQL